MSLSFPACWDGENLDSEDHRSHMAYPTNEDNGCPDSHPGGFSGHGDVVLAWADGVVDWWTENCLRASASCTIGGEG